MSSPAFIESPSNRYKTIRDITRIEMDILGMSMNQLTDVLAQPDAQKIVSQKCHHCDTMLECRAIVAPFVACDDCIKRHAKEEKMKRHQNYWQAIVPSLFLKTDTNHPEFPKETYELAKKIDPSKSIFCYGPSGSAKTRVAIQLLKRALLRDQHVGILWPEKLAGLKSDFNDSGSLERYAAYDLLLLDDVLLTAVRSSKHIDALKQLIDLRMRHERPFIITSQIGSEADLTSGKEFGDAKPADIERVKALLRRLNECCEVVNFEKKTGEF